MLKSLFVALLLSLSALAQSPTYVNNDQILPTTTATKLPTHNTGYNTAWVTDGASGSDCATGGGSTLVLCYWTGSAWTAYTGTGGGAGTGSCTNQAVTAVNVGAPTCTTLTSAYVDSSLATAAGTQALTNKTLTGATSGNSVTLLNFQSGTATLTGNSGAQTIFSYTLPANTLTTGKGIRIRTRALQVGSTSTTYAVSFGGTNVISYATTVAANSYIDVDIFDSTGTGQQIVIPNLMGSANAVTSPTITDPAIDTTGAVTILLTFNVANTVTLTKYAWTIELIQ